MIMKDFKGPGFSMEVPTDWYITSNPRIQVMFVSPPQEGGFQANLMVTMNPVKEDVTVESVAEETKKNQQAQYPEYAVLAEGFVEDTEEKAFQREFEWFNKDKSIDVHQTQVMLLVEQMLYVLTTTRPALKEKTEAIKRVDALMQMMVESFKLD